MRVQICGYQTTDRIIAGRPISVCSPNRSGVDLTAADARALAADLLAAADEMDEAQRTSA
jgi:hypothetical protein